jgi:uncharacterized protein (DUF2267 family)
MATLPELSDELVIEVFRKAAHPHRGLARDYDPLLELVAWAAFKVLERHVSAGAILDVKHVLPALIRSLWPASARFHRE